MHCLLMFAKSYSGQLFNESSLDLYLFFIKYKFVTLFF